MAVIARPKNGGDRPDPIASTRLTPQERVHELLRSSAEARTFSTLAQLVLHSPVQSPLPPEQIRFRTLAGVAMEDVGPLLDGITRAAELFGQRDAIESAERDPETLNATYIDKIKSLYSSLAGHSPISVEAIRGSINGSVSAQDRAVALFDIADAIAADLHRELVAGALSGVLPSVFATDLLKHCSTTESALVEIGEQRGESVQTTYNLISAFRERIAETIDDFSRYRFAATPTPRRDRLGR